MRLYLKQVPQLRQDRAFNLCRALTETLTAVELFDLAEFVLHY